MRKLDKIIVWPTYFDSVKTRKDGRRVPKNLAISSPKISEIAEAVRELGLKTELVPDVGYPKTPWLKMGVILVEKNEAKDQMIRRIAKQLLKIRSLSNTK
jgi:signal recognition particle subunit SRP19